MRSLLEQTARISAGYVEALDARRMRPTLQLLNRFGSPATVAMAGPRFFGFVIGGSLPAALASNWLAGAWDQNAGLFLSSPVAAVLEEAKKMSIAACMPCKKQRS